MRNTLHVCDSVLGLDRSTNDTDHGVDRGTDEDRAVGKCYKYDLPNLVLRLEKCTRLLPPSLHCIAASEVVVEQRLSPFAQ